MFDVEHRLPPEIWVYIVQLASSRHPDGHLQGLIDLALVSKRLHHLIFCGENDTAVWKPAAVNLGIHPDTLLDEVLFAGTGTLEARSWRRTYKFLREWQKPFNTDTKLPKARKVAWNLPDLKGKGGDGSIRRTFEMCCAGAGRGLAYKLKQPVAADMGNLVFEAQRREPKPGSNGEKLVSAAGFLRAGEERASQVSGRPREIPSHSPFPYPLPAGHFVTEKNGQYTVTRISMATGQAEKQWFFGERQPHRFVSTKDIMIAVAHHGPEDELADIPGLTSALNATSILLCLKAGDPKPIWKIDTTFSWYREDDDYRAFPHIRNFHVTSKYLVVLMTRHPSAHMRKVSGTYFVVMSLMTGVIEREIKIHKKAVSPAPGQGQNIPGVQGPLQQVAAGASYTTAFNHDFVLMDSILISGGPAGELLVWCLFGENASDMPIFSVPLDRYGPYQKTFTDLKMSVCGTYFAVVTSREIYIYDIITRKPIELYHNGRHINDGNRFAGNPPDDFPPGIWVRWRDWKAVEGTMDDSSKKWKPVAEGVAYLSEAGVELSYENPLKALTVPSRRPGWMRALASSWDDNASWVIIFLAGLVFVGVYSVLGVGKTYLAGQIGGYLERDW